MYQIRGMSSAPDNRFYQTAHGDRRLAVIILAISIGALLAMAHHRAGVGTRALVHAGTAAVQALDLSIDQVITNSIAGHTAQFEISRGRIRIRESACPRKLCMHTGWISRPGEMIVCVPNALLIEVAGASGRPAYDAVSH